MIHPDNIIDELRDLIVLSAPDPQQAKAVRSCSRHDQLDAIIPFSSIIVLGAVVAIEDRFGVHITRQLLETTLRGGPTLAKLASMVESLQRNRDED